MKSLFLGNKIVLNEADEGKGEQLRAGKPRKEEDEEVMTFNQGVPVCFIYADYNFLYM